MKAAVVAVLIPLGLAGCATPVITLKNEATGETATCGGGMAGSIALGLIGHNLEKQQDERCARELEAKGFKRS